MDHIGQIGASEAPSAAAAQQAEQTSPPEGQQSRGRSPPPGWEALRAGMPLTTPMKKTADFTVFPSSAHNDSPHELDQMRFQIKEAIPADATVTDNRNTSIRYRPNDGPMGFGYYKESDEAPNVINFYPVCGISEYMQTHPQGGYQAASHNRHSKRVPPPFPYPPPPQQRSPPPPDPIDPNFLAWYQETMNMNPKHYASWHRQNIIDQRVEPMLDYVARLRGPQAEKCHKALIEKASELSPVKAEPPKGEAWFAERRGMLGREEYMKPVSYFDGVTDWRKDPYYRSKKRLEEREKAEKAEGGGA